MMRHDPKFATFHGAYLNEMVQFDIQNTFLGEQAEDQLYKLFAHVSRSSWRSKAHGMPLKLLWESTTQP